jgi:hypothetical protein
MKSVAIAFAMLLVVELVPGVVYAQGGGKGSCPGGLSACIERCAKGGGQQRLCASWCQKNRGC